MMKPIATLTLQDLHSTSVWRFHGESDEDGLAEPTNRTSLSESDDEAYIAATEFTLADGTVHLGYSSPSDRSGLDYIQPVIITDAGHVRFWFDRPISRDSLIQGWTLLHRAEDEIFPIRWRSLVPVEGEHVEGVVNKAEVLAQAS